MPRSHNKAQPGAEHCQRQRHQRHHPGVNREQQPGGSLFILNDAAISGNRPTAARGHENENCKREADYGDPFPELKFICFFIQSFCYVQFLKHSALQYTIYHQHQTGRLKL